MLARRERRRQGDHPQADSFPEPWGAPCNHLMDDVTLPPEFERFAAEAVSAGRYRDLSDVGAAGVTLLQRQEQARAELLASVLAAEAEAERDGCLTGDDMLARVRARLAEKYGAAV